MTTLSKLRNALAYEEAEAGTNLQEAFKLAKEAVAGMRSRQATGEYLGNDLDTLAWIEHKLGKDDDASRDYARGAR